MSAADLQHHLDLADRALEAGDTDMARRHFEAVLKIDDAQPLARNWLGVDALSRGDGHAAVVHFEQSATAEPAERGHWINLAMARRSTGDAAGERAALERALDLDQQDLLALIRMAEMHERLGEETAAAERWAAVVQLSAAIADPAPEFAAILAHARAYLDRRRKQLADSVEGALHDELAKASPRDERRMRRAADAWLGRKTIYVNHCEGLHYPFLPADEFFDRELFPWLDRLEAQTAAIQNELEALLANPGNGLEPYIALPSGVPASKWSALDKSLDWGAFHLWKEGVRFDEACARTPHTATFVDSLPLCRIEGRAPNVFFSILKAGTHIPAHTGTTNVRSIIHLPLIVPPGCSFRVGGETREWAEGEGFAFDDTIEHEAWNRSDRDRAVLIIDCWNPHLGEHERAMIRQLYGAADAQRS